MLYLSNIKQFSELTVSDCWSDICIMSDLLSNKTNNCLVLKSFLVVLD